MSTWSNLSLQDGASPLMEQLSFFHDHTMVVLLLITVINGKSHMSCETNTNKEMEGLASTYLSSVQPMDTHKTELMTYIPSFRNFVPSSGSSEGKKGSSESGFSYSQPSLWSNSES